MNLRDTGSSCRWGGGRANAAKKRETLVADALILTRIADFRKSGTKFSTAQKI
ncbi:MAG: hypothetical protein IJO06_06540 [Thermoguttaceae bacterium]|nr:hypothetical protein [Thermoguttaceae bacterium]